MAIAYLASDGFLDDLRREIGDIDHEIFGNLILAERPAPTAYWAANVWYEPVRLPIASIGDAAKQLRAIQRNWACYAYDFHRRATLITENLPKVSAKPLVFGTKPPAAPLGSWCLIGRDEILASAKCSSPFPNGEMEFIEDRVSSPSRAYLKLWDVFTRLGVQPAPGELCVDLGSCPGGWTWVLQNIGARVLSVDKAPLAPSIAALPNIEFRQGSAFALEPSEVGPVDWLFSDVICYPKRLYALVQRWMESGMAKRFICTIKFQGETDFDAVAQFAAIPNSQVMHLHHNKHELTWVKVS